MTSSAKTATAAGSRTTKPMSPVFMEPCPVSAQGLTKGNSEEGLEPGPFISRAPMGVKQRHPQLSKSSRHTHSRTCIPPSLRTKLLWRGSLIAGSVRYSRVAGLVEFHREVPRHLEPSRKPVASVGDLIGKLDTLLFELVDGFMNVVAVEGNIVRPRWRVRLHGMTTHLGIQQFEDQPP